MTITRKIAAAVTAAAIVAPGAAQAKPVDIHAPLARAAAAQDLRSPDAREAARTSSLAGTTSRQDLRSPDARDAAIPRRRAIDAPGATAVGSATRPAPPAAPGQPTWPVDPQPISPASEPVPATSNGDGVDWAPIGIGIVGGLLAVGGLAALTARRRSHVAA